MTHLLEQGYRNIGHISGPLEWWEARQINEEGWQGNNQVDPQTILLSPKLITRRSSLRRKEQEVNPSRVT